MRKMGMMMMLAEDLKCLLVILVPAHLHRDQCPGGNTPGTEKENENESEEGAEREKRGVDKRRVFMPRDASSSSGQED